MIGLDMLKSCRNAVEDSYDPYVSVLCEQRGWCSHDETNRQ